MGPNDLLKAKWPDGIELICPGVMVKQYTALTSRELRVKKGTGMLVEFTHVDTKHLISVQQRVDRKLLMSVYDQGRQILMVNQDLFGAVENQHVQQDLDSRSLQACLKFMTDIAENYAAGRIPKESLKEVRDERLHSLGLLVSSRRNASGTARASTPAAAARPSESSVPQAAASSETTRPQRGRQVSKRGAGQIGRASGRGSFSRGRRGRKNGSDGDDGDDDRGGKKRRTSPAATVADDEDDDDEDEEEEQGAGENDDQSECAGEAHHVRMKPAGATTTTSSSSVPTSSSDSTSTSSPPAARVPNVATAPKLRGVRPSAKHATPPVKSASPPVSSPPAKAVPADAAPAKAAARGIASPLVKNKAVKARVVKACKAKPAAHAMTTPPMSSLDTVTRFTELASD